MDSDEVYDASPQDAVAGFGGSDVEFDDFGAECENSALWKHGFTAGGDGDGDVGFG